MALEGVAFEPSLARTPIPPHLLLDLAHPGFSVTYSLQISTNIIHFCRSKTNLHLLSLP